MKQWREKEDKNKKSGAREVSKTIYGEVEKKSKNEELLCVRSC